jgi:anti-anti-sigma factor
MRSSGTLKIQEELKMLIKKTLENGKITFALDGRLDDTTAPQLQDALIPAFDEAKEVELDFAHLTHISSAGLRVLLTGLKTGKAKGVSMTVYNVSKEIMEIFKMTGFSEILKMTEFSDVLIFK